MTASQERARLLNAKGKKGGNFVESIAKKIVKYRILILIVATILLIPSGIGFIKTKVNYDILTSLPETANAIVGQNILGDDFGQKATAMVTVKGLPDKEVKKIADKYYSNRNDSK